MQYCVTIEQTRRIAIPFCADSDEDAKAMAMQISEQTSDAEFASGDEERDYALYNDDTQRTVLDWV